WHPAGTSTAVANKETGKSKVDLAIDFIREHSVATDAQLRAVMSLPASAWPSSYLQIPVKRGVLVREGKEWRLGAGHVQPAAAEPAKPAAPPPSKPSTASIAAARPETDQPAVNSL